MRWSFTLAQIGATTVRLHLTFLLLVAWVGAIYWRSGGPAAALDGVLFIILVFLCVVLHEFGHVAAARRYGVRTPDITLYPFGGVASLERMPESPRQEIVVALAGPLVNVAIAAVLLVLLGARFDFRQVAEIQQAQMSLLGRLAAVNVILVLFNLIPAFPTDGGRVLRAALSLRMDRVRATRVAAYAGQAFAGLFVVLGLMGNPLLLLVGVFIFFAANAETEQVRQRAGARGHVAADAAIRRFESLGPQSTAEDASRLLLLTTQQEFPVVESGGALLGMVTRRGLIEAMKQGGDTAVAAFMDREVPVAEESEPLERVMDKVARSPSRTVALMDRGGRFTGYVSRENMVELFMVDDARRAAG